MILLLGGNARLLACKWYLNKAKNTWTPQLQSQSCDQAPPPPPSHPGFELCFWMEFLNSFLCSFLVLLMSYSVKQLSFELPVCLGQPWSKANLSIS